MNQTGGLFLICGEFALKHRYVMVLHTDEPHPHVHVIVKSIGDGRRLNIKKAQLNEWRLKFAAHPRELSVAANATPRPFRGRSNLHRKEVD